MTRNIQRTLAALFAGGVLVITHVTTQLVLEQIFGR